MSNSGIIIVLAYPETIVKVSNEWYSPLLKYAGIGKKDYVRAGHAALVLIEKGKGEICYYDFGRYITPQPMGRVRSKETDGELDFSLEAQFTNGQMTNLEEILSFLATQPQFTHGVGNMYASVCDEVDFERAKAFINEMQDKLLIRYGAFVKKASNCARFVTDVLIASTTNKVTQKKLIGLKRFTPSTIGNVVAAANDLGVFKVSETGFIEPFSSDVGKINKECLLDPLKDFKPSSLGTMVPQKVGHAGQKAQWLSGIGSGAWFEILETDGCQVVFRRISPNGHIDVHDVFSTETAVIDWNSPFEFTHHSNCKFFHIQQEDKIVRFNRGIN
ncbi:DUF6695 family protein [Mangrovimonas sp. ST2L15]|uniref:DUF6695 family protein n=1 Tax=Mangrovimonas sp. ST2L15 TaxID=1645916 RepID=UPI0006B4B6D8|nr:DUF6695 family protein [Mangrovimonas sp. ST2L15]